MNEALSHQTYDIVWTTAVAGFIVIFCVFETWAFIDKKTRQDTLSGHVWRWIGTRKGWTGWHIPARLGVMILFLWLAEHFSLAWF